MSARRNDTARRRIRTPVDFRFASEEAEREWLNTFFRSFVEKREEPKSLVARMVERRWIARQRDTWMRGH